MLALLLAACGSGTPDATLDDDNWLKGTPVDAADPPVELAGVHIDIGEPLGDEWRTIFVTYYREPDGIPIGILQADFAFEGDEIVYDYDRHTVHFWAGFAHSHEYSAVVDMTINYGWTEAAGTFETDGSDLHGSFSGPIHPDEYEYDR